MRLVMRTRNIARVLALGAVAVALAAAFPSRSTAQDHHATHQYEGRHG